MLVQLHVQRTTNIFLLPANRCLHIKFKYYLLVHNNVYIVQCFHLPMKEVLKGKGVRKRVTASVCNDCGQADPSINEPQCPSKKKNNK